MLKDRLFFTKSFVISIALHVVFFGILLSTMSFATKQPQITVNLQKHPQDDKEKIVKASLIDKKAVDAAVQRQAMELAKEQQRHKQAEEQLQIQERRAAELKREAEQAKLALEAAAAQKAKLEAETKKAAAEKLRLEKEQQQIKKQQALQQAQAKKDSEIKAAQKKAVEAKQIAAKKAQDANEAARLAAIKAQQDRIAAEHMEFLASEVDKYRAAFQAVIEDNRILSAIFTGEITCKIRIRLLPDGSIASVNVVESSGNSAYDEQSMAAVYKSAPFPMPQDQELYTQLRDIVLSFRNGEQASDAI